MFLRVQYFFIIIIYIIVLSKLNNTDKLYSFADDTTLIIQSKLVYLISLTRQLLERVLK